ncbi:MAG TPA: hypothetical protein VK894_14300, partial [Jiangellales bacterium]|nr:hypothetical protein [Jiangellales bacterium]
WTVRRAWPADDRIDLELAGPGGRLLAAVASGGRLDPVGLDDRRLPALSGWAAVPGARLVVHRPRRRAVVEVPRGAGPVAGVAASSTAGRPSYVKVARPPSAERALRAHRTLASLLADAPGAPALPQVDAADPAAGWVRTASLPGRSLLDVLADPRSDAAALDVAGTAAGNALGVLARTTPAGLPEHASPDEAAVLSTWVDRLARYAPLGGDVVARVRDLAHHALAELTALPTAPAVTAHRDLHDQQVLVHRGRAALLDLDTAAAADPGLDEGNLLAHLDLRVWQGLATAARARRLARAVVAARSAVAPVDAARVAAHHRATRARLAALYAFRPGARTVVPRLLDSPSVVLPDVPAPV